MDRGVAVTKLGPTAVGPLARWTREYGALDDWFAAEALEAAVTAEDELAVDWRRYCRRLRCAYGQGASASPAAGSSLPAGPRRVGAW